MGHIELSGISYHLPDGRVLLDDVSFRVADGAIIALDPLPYIIANSVLTLLDQQPRDGIRAAAAQTALTHHTGQPGALDA